MLVCVLGFTQKIQPGRLWKAVWRGFLVRPDEQKQWYVSGTATLEEPTLSETDVCCERQEKQGFSFPLIIVKKVVLNSNKN